MKDLDKEVKEIVEGVGKVAGGVWNTCMRIAAWVVLCILLMVWFHVAWWQAIGWLSIACISVCTVGRWFGRGMKGGAF